MSRLRTAAGQELAELAARLADGARLTRGRKYQRQGNVMELDISPGWVTAQVLGSRREPYTVSIATKAANENERRAAASDPSGAVPRVLDIAFTCICPDWGDPCKHGVAVLLELAAQADDDPSLLLEWRGIRDLVPPPPAGTESLVDTGDRSTSEPAATRRSREGAGEPVEPQLEGSLLEFFHGAMPTVATELVGPLEERQPDTFRHVRIPLERLDAAPIFAAAADAIADHWLGF